MTNYASLRIDCTRLTVVNNVLAAVKVEKTLTNLRGDFNAVYKSSMAPVPVIAMLA